MIRVTLFSLMLTVLLVGSGCSGMRKTDASSVTKELSPGIMFLYSEAEESGEQPYPVRIFVNSEYMRINENDSPNDFILFDRKAKVIYNVVSEGKTIFVIDAKQGVKAKPPIAIDYKEEKQESSVLMKAKDGSQAYHYRFYANGQVCYNVVAVKDYMPDAVQAYKEFREVLAGEHSKTIGSIPQEMQDPCDLALNVFEPTRHLQHGFPVREWDGKGYQRFLVDVKQNITLPAEMFVLPKDYTRFSVEPAVKQQ